MNEATGERASLKAQFLRAAGLADSAREALPRDASTRIYERVRRKDGSTLILMDQPPEAEGATAPPDASDEARKALGYNACARLAGGRVDAFVAVAGYFRSLGLSAPEIYDYDAGLGFALVEDLGEDLYARLISEGTDPEPLYEAATDVQTVLHAAAPPAWLEYQGARWAVTIYDDLALRTYTELFLDWWPKYRGSPPLPLEARADWETLCRPLRNRAEAAALGLAHRDYHAENLIWLPKRTGLARVGLLDFQDAVKAHPAWDLLHLLQDARRDVEPALEAKMLERFLAGRPQSDQERFLSDYRALAALNATRILGPIFARQVVAFGRTKYAAFMPRTWRYLKRNLEHPDLAELRAWFDRWLPQEMGA